MGDPRISHIANDTHILLEHVHTEQMVHPTLADPVTLTSGVGVWTLSAGFTEIVAAAAITDDFDIHGIDISSPDTNEDYEIVLYAVEVEIGRVSFSRANNFVNSIHVTITTPLIPKNTQIQAKMADGTGGSIAKIKLYYHTY